MKSLPESEHSILANTSDTIIESAPIRSRARIATLLGFLALILIWGSFPVAAKIGVENAPPLLLSGARFCLAFIIMAATMMLRRKSLRITPRQHHQIWGVSLCMVGVPSSIFFASAPYAPVGVLTLMWSMSPIFTALFNLGGYGELRGWRLLVSLCVGTIGVLIVLLGHIPFVGGSSGLNFAANRPALIAELAVLGSSMIYGLGLFLAKRSAPALPVLTMTTWQMFYSGIFIVLVGLIVEHGMPIQPNWIALSDLLYLAVFCGCITFLLTFWLIRRIGAIRIAYTDFIIPGITLVLSYFILGESLTLAKLGGLVLVTLSVILVGV
jgi:drug/metabolite transporter (DMT)-like permease